jgi:hypothetical protein
MAEHEHCRNGAPTVSPRCTDRCPHYADVPTTLQPPSAPSTRWSGCCTSSCRGGSACSPTAPPQHTDTIFEQLAVRQLSVGPVLSLYHLNVLTQTSHHSAAAKRSFDEVERLLYEQLSGLCRDASWLSAYMAAAQLAVKEAMQKSVISLGPSKQPIPSFRHRQAEHGAVAENGELAAQMPEVRVDATQWCGLGVSCLFQPCL